MSSFPHSLPTMSTDLGSNLISGVNFEPATTANTTMNTCQDISSRKINPTKLNALLKTKFGVGSYEICVSLTASSRLPWRSANPNIDDAERVHHSSPETTITIWDRSVRMSITLAVCQSVFEVFGIPVQGAEGNPMGVGWRHFVSMLKESIRQVCWSWKIILVMGRNE